MKSLVALRAIALVTLMAFAMNAMLPFFASVTTTSAQAAEQNELSSLFGEKILICTATGFKWVTWAELQDQKQQPAQSDYYKCPVCFAGACSAPSYLPTDFQIIKHALSTATFAYLLVDGISRKSEPLLLGRHSRAPPHLA
jgi:hypothetical protein